jgi:hypothetical protein
MAEMRTRRGKKAGAAEPRDAATEFSHSLGRSGSRPYAPARPRTRLSHSHINTSLAFRSGGNTG